MKIQLSDHFSYGKLLRFVLPSILMILCTSVYNIVDGFFVSNYVSSTAFSAVNLMAPFTMAIAAIGFMLGIGGCAVVSATMGEGKKAEANQYFSMLVLAAFGIAVLVALPAFIFTPQIAAAMGAEGEFLQASVTYGRILFSAAPFFVLQMCFQSFFVVAEKPSLSLTVNICAGVANIVLDYLLVVVFPLGIAGAATATAIGQCIGGIFPIIYFMRKNTSLLRLTGKFRMQWQTLGRACANGSSEMVSQISTSFINTLFNLQLLKFAGENGVAAYGIIMYVNIIFSALFMGYSIGSAPIVSFHYGAENYAELKNMFHKSLVLMIAAGIISASMAIILAKPLALIFASKNPELLTITVRGSIIYALAYLFMGLNVWGSSFFTALNNGVISATISFMRTLLFQLGAVLILPAIWKLDGIWLSVVVAEMLAVLVTAAFLVNKRKVYKY